ncbi:MAG: hypothetical protein HRT98_00305 [Mycoplasmatales bacterium]|nr:hypothetical protein [Mycoplasmatales bacterium]
MKRKIKLGIGALAVLTTPILTVVSCNSKRSTLDLKDIKNRVEKLTTLSNNHKNILLFFNDEVTGDTAYEMLKKRKDIQENLLDFTIYKNTVSDQYTNFGIPAIVGGWDFTLRNQDIGTLKDKTNWESIKLAYTNSMSMLSKAGYSQQWHSMQYADKENDDDALDKNVKINFPNQKDLTSTSTTELNKIYGNYNTFESWTANALRSSLTFKEHLKSNKTKKPIFKFFGNEATHKNFAALDKKTNQPIAGVKSDEAIIYSLKYISEIEKKIKSMGQDIWNNTMIIYVSDHGSARQPWGLTSNNSKEMHHMNNKNARMNNNWVIHEKENVKNVWTTRMNPSIMIKPFKDGTKKSEHLKFDDETFLSNRDIPTIIRNAIKSYNKNFTYQVANKNGTDYPSFREDPLNQTTDRTINIYPVKENDWKPQYNKKNHSNLSTRIRVTNNIFKRENWEWSDYKNTHWEKMWNPTTP